MLSRLIIEYDPLSTMMLNQNVSMTLGLDGDIAKPAAKYEKYWLTQALLRPDWDNVGGVSGRIIPRRRKAPAMTNTFGASETHFRKRTLNSWPHVAWSKNSTLRWQFPIVSLSHNDHLEMLSRPIIWKGSLGSSFCTTWGPAWAWMGLDGPGSLHFMDPSTARGRTRHSKPRCLRWNVPPWGRTYEPTRALAVGASP